MQDNPINLDEITELDDASVFKLESQPLRTYEKDYNVQMDFTIEMNLSQRVVARDGYTFLDYLSDIGGIQGIFISLVMFLMTIFNHNYFDNWMVTRLYRMENKDDVEKK